MKLFTNETKKDKWVGILELIGMFLILVSFYYQTFYEGNALEKRYENIRFKLELIQREVIHNSELSRNQSDYNLGNIWEEFNDNRDFINEISEDHISGIDRAQAVVSSVRAWIFIIGSMMLIIAKYLQYFWHPQHSD